MYLVIGINEEGIRDVLGFWLHDGEGASSWMQIVTELQNRGVEDILISCVDGLKGFPEAIEKVFPHTQIQLCIVHMIRNSLKYVNCKDRRSLAADLKQVYTAANEKQTGRELQKLEEKWVKYPQVPAQWKRNWVNIVPMYSYPQELRKVIYKTNAIESLNSTIRKSIRNKGSFPIDESAMKMIYLSLRTHKGKEWQNTIKTWSRVHQQLSMIFKERITKYYEI